MKVNTEVGNIKVTLELSPQEATLLKAMFSYDCSIPELVFRFPCADRDQLSSLMTGIHRSLLQSSK